MTWCIQSSIRFASAISMVTIGLAAQGCASSKLMVQSQPEGAEVSMRRGDLAPVRIGKTPLELSSGLAPGLFDDTVVIEIAKGGFQPQRFVIPRAAIAAQGKILASLQEDTLPLSCSLQGSASNELARGVAEAQALLVQKKADEAARILQELSMKFRNVSTVWALLGNAWYLQKDLRQALHAYNKALELEPDNHVTGRMVSKIKGILGSSRGLAGGD